MSRITDTEFSVEVAGHTLTGIAYEATPPVPTGSGVAHDAYLARNATKSVNCYALRGIEYAHQPVGVRRFAPAVMKPVTGDIDARRFGPVAPQGWKLEGIDLDQGRSDLGVNYSSYDYAARGTYEDESCLNLSVYAKTFPGMAGHPVGGRPTVIMFHGGAGNYGTASDPRQSPHRATAYGINYVQVEYRLANLGHYALAGGSATTNFSVTDAIAALDWVIEHGEDLGFDLDKITLAGGSFGGNLCQVLAADLAQNSKFQRMWISSPSAGINKRWKAEVMPTFIGYDAYFANRRLVNHAIFKLLRSTADSNKTLAQIEAELITGGNTADEAYATVMREHMNWRDFIKLDGGAYGQQIGFNGSSGTGVPFNDYQATRSGTIMQDDVTCDYESNRAAAVSTNLFGVPDVVIVVAEDEASVIGGGAPGNLSFSSELHDLCNDTMQGWANSPVYDTEWNAAAGSPTWGATSTTERYYPWGTATEPNRMIFNHGYQHSAYCWARMTEATGADAYLIFNNFNYSASFGTRVGHTKDEPSWLFNPEWTCLPPLEGELEGLTVTDILEADAAAAMFARFCATGDPSGTWAEAVGFDLFETPKTMALTAFSPTNKNWNVWGGYGRSASTPVYTLSSVNGWWDHAWDYYDQRIGVS